MVKILFMVGGIILAFFFVRHLLQIHLGWDSSLGRLEAKWNTYTSQQLTYQVSYPPGWTIVDESYDIDSGPIIGFRAISPVGNYFPGTDARPVFFDAYICYSKALSQFDDHCYGTGSESLSFDFVGKAGDQSVDKVQLRREELVKTPEYGLAKAILNSAHLIPQY